MALGNSYDYITEKWHSSPRGQSYVERVFRYVDLILESLPAQAKILDLGCGTGRPIAEYVIEKGFAVTGVDQSKKMLEIAAEVIPSATLLHANIIDFKTDEKFAAVIAWDSIFHVERKYHSDIYHEVWQLLEPGGKFLSSVGGSGAESFTSEMYGQEFSYSGFEPDEARKLLETAGFEIELWELDDPSSRGHFAVIGRKTTKN